MRYLIVLIFCLFCSCTYIEEYIGITAPAEMQSSPSISASAEKQNIGGTTSSLKSPEDKINASRDQSKHLESESPYIKDNRNQSFEITRNSLLIDVRGLKIIKPSKSEINVISPFHNGGRQDDVITVNSKGEVFLWDANSHYKNSYRIFELPAGYTSAAVSSHSTLLAAAYPGVVRVFDIKGGEEVYSISRINTRISYLEFNSKSDALLLAGVDSVVYRWQFVLEKEADTIIDLEKSLERYVGHSAVVNLAKFHPYGRVFVSTDWGGAINAWLLYDQDKYHGAYDENIFSGRTFAEDAKRARGSRAPTSIIEQINFSSDGQYLFTADEDGAIEIWLIRGFKSHASIAAHKGKIYDFSFNSKLNRLVSLGRDSKLKIWQLNEKESKIPGVKDHTLDLLKEFNLIELSLAEARKVIYLNDEHVLLANRDGSLSILNVKI